MSRHQAYSKRKAELETGSGRLGGFTDPLECMQEQLRGGNKRRERKDKRSKSHNKN